MVDGQDLTHANARERDRRRHRAHPGGPPSARPRAAVLADREPRAARVPQAPNSRYGFLNLSAMIARAPQAAEGVRRARRQPGDAAPSRSPAATSRRSSLAREIDGDPKVLIAAQPTRGLDVGAIEFVHRRLVEQRDAGRAIFLVSLELEEILSLSDRILVIYEGRIVGEFPPTATEEELGLAMTGGGVRRRRPRDATTKPRDPTHGRRRRAPTRGAARRRRPAAASGSRLRARPAAIIAPLITTLIAFLMGGLVVLAHRQEPDQGLPRDLQRDRASTGSSTSAIGADPVLDRHVVPVDTASVAAQNLQQTLLADDADHPDGARSRVRVPLRHVQHRRPGPVLRRHDLRRLARLLVRGMNPFGAHRRSCSWSARSRARSTPASPGSSRRPSERTR